MKSSDKLDELAPALVGAQGKLRNPKTDAKGQVRGRQDYTYLSLGALTDHVREVFRTVGLAFLQEETPLDGGVGITTRIVHLSGQWIELGPAFIPAEGGPQDFGSAITYGCRYSLSAAVGISGERDDDAAKAQARTVEAPARRGASGSERGPRPCSSCGGTDTFVAGRFLRCRDCGHAEPVLAP